MPTANSLPWDILFDHFQKHPAGPKIFRAIQLKGGGLQGIIVALWDDPNNSLPSRYLPEEAELGGWSNVYLGSDSTFPRFNDSTKPQNPKIYGRLYSSNIMVNRLRTECEGYNKASRKPPIHVGLTLWQHPEAHYLPIDEFLKMQKQFPGCIRQ